MSTLLKLARNFEQKVAYSTFDAVLASMKQFANGAIIATKHLLSKPRYTKSTGLAAINAKMPALVSALQSTNMGNATEMLPKMKNIIEEMSFYTLHANIGTGYDPMTNIREDGYSAPSYYINVLFVLFEKLDQSVKHILTEAM